MARSYRKLAHWWCRGSENFTTTVWSSVLDTESMKVQMLLYGTTGFLPSSMV